jgi:hypothetical protein
VPWHQSWVTVRGLGCLGQGYGDFCRVRDLSARLWGLVQGYGFQCSVINRAQGRAIGFRVGLWV